MLLLFNQIHEMRKYIRYTFEDDIAVVDSLVVVAKEWNQDAQMDFINEHSLADVVAW